MAHAKALTLSESLFSGSFCSGSYIFLFNSHYDAFDFQIPQKNS